MVGPDYRQPQTQLPANWSTTEIGSPAAKMADISRWWTVFNDPVLTELMGKAQAGNRDLYQAEARLREARARRQLAKANLLPTSSLTASARQSGSSEAAALAPPASCTVIAWMPVGKSIFSAKSGAPSKRPRRPCRRHRKICATF
ncbi:MAG: TolC family protein [Methylobacter sp.]|uniref:TolC family protein n=1 Tax=Methylobacter sp. TaxID=2051955 RepID=UPI00272FB722|nr:TolC family protein [Methylobacter sp.]MDP1664521.1 TolC family protein [Methylobacter sp.]